MTETFKIHSIEDLILNTVGKTTGITSEQIDLVRELYKDDARNLDEIREELLAYSASVIDSKYGIPMKQSKKPTPYYLNIQAPIKGIHLGETQIDLISVIEVTTIDELQEFLIGCAQLNYAETDLQQLCKMDLETAKRKVFEDYRRTLIGTVDLKKNPFLLLKRKIACLGLPEEANDIVIALCKKGNLDEAVNYITTNISADYNTIIAENFRGHSLDWDDVKCTSYEELSALAQEIANFNCITVTSGKYRNVMNNGTFDPYHIKRELDFCKKHGVQARYHSLLSKDTMEYFKGKPKEEIAEQLRSYVSESINFINSYNEENKLADGRPVIRSVDIFNELINLKKDKNSAKGYYNIWEQLGLTTTDIVDIFAPAIGNKKENIEYVYNEAFVETEEKRRAQLQLVQDIHHLAPELIDIFGTQMHITTEFNPETIERTFLDLKQFSNSTGIKIAITEFDMYIPEKTLEHLIAIGKTTTQIDEYANHKKKAQLETIVKAANNTKIDFSEVSYWSATDSMDHNKKRQHQSNLYGGLFGNQLAPKGANEVIDYSPELKRPDNAIDVLDNLSLLEAMLTSSILPTIEADTTETKQFVKKAEKVIPQNTNDDGGFTNFPQLLIMSLILIAVLYIILM